MVKPIYNPDQRPPRVRGLLYNNVTNRLTCNRNAGINECIYDGRRRYYFKGRTYNINRGYSQALAPYQ